MIKITPEAAWLKLKDLLPQEYKRDDPKRYMPINLQYQGQIIGPFGTVLPDEILQCLKLWLIGRGETEVFYFLTEFCKGDEINFKIKTEEIDYDALSEINKGMENIIVSQSYQWLIFTDHDGGLYVAGPEELYATLRDCWSQIAYQVKKGVNTRLDIHLGDTGL